jgi:hypothetical protein
MAAQGEDQFLLPGQLVKVKMPDDSLLGAKVVDPASLKRAEKAAVEAKQPVRSWSSLPPATLPVSVDAALRARRARLGRRSAAKTATAAHQRLACGGKASRGAR